MHPSRRWPRGDAQNARELELYLVIHQPADAAEAHAMLARLAAKLTLAATERSLSIRAEDEIELGVGGRWRFGDRRLRLLREDWPDGGRYDLKFHID